jgi:hypothetical protein
LRSSTRCQWSSLISARATRAREAAGVVHEDVEPAEARHDARDGVINARGIRHVHRHPDRLTAVGDDVVDGLVGAV